MTLVARTRSFFSLLITHHRALPLVACRGPFLGRFPHVNSTMPKKHGQQFIRRVENGGNGFLSSKGRNLAEMMVKVGCPSKQPCWLPRHWSSGLAFGLLPAPRCTKAQRDTHPQEPQHYLAQPVPD